MTGQLRQGPTLLRSTPFIVQCAKRLQQRAGVDNGRFGRRRQPRQTLHLALAPDGDIEHQRSEVGIQYFGLAYRFHSGLGSLAPQPIAYARSDASGSTGALRGHIHRYAHGIQMAQPTAWVENHLATQSAIDHHTHTLDGQRRLGDGRSEHHLAFARGTGRNGPSLLVVGQEAVKWVYLGG